jgi:hypothetical protein
MRIFENKYWRGGLLILTSALLVLPATLFSASCGDEPIYDNAVVDGDASEWIPADDFFAPIYKDGDSGSDVLLCNAYLRYDLNSKVLYVLVEKASIDRILVENGENVWIKIDNNKMVSSDNSEATGQPTFAWINSDGTYADGWEASFSLTQFIYLYNLQINNNVWSGGVSQNAGTDTNGLPLWIESPEIDYGDAPNDGGLYNYGEAGSNLGRGDLVCRIGDYIDGDSQYWGDVTAELDDTIDGSDDEKGVSWFRQNTDGSWSVIDGSQFYIGKTYKVVVNIALKCCTSAKVAAWFDFFIDGEFGNVAEESIIDNALIDNSSGSYVELEFEQTFLVPTGASLGTTYLRFRLDCQTDDLTPTGIGRVAGEVEDYITSIAAAPPVSVTLTSFAATYASEGILVEWDVASEIGHAGYNLYRSTSKTGPWSKLNDIIIRTPEFNNQTNAQQYQFIDINSSEEIIYYRLEAISMDGTSDYYGPVQVAAISAVKDQIVANTFTLEQNYPNPFNPYTTIEYALPEPTDVTLIIYDIQGRVVKTIVDAVQAAGRHSLVWDATNDFGESAPSGLYVCRMKTAHFTKMSRMTLLK